MEFMSRVPICLLSRNHRKHFNEIFASQPNVILTLLLQALLSWLLRDPKIQFRYEFPKYNGLMS
jgi:hypothetical protein